MFKFKFTHLSTYLFYTHSLIACCVLEKILDTIGWKRTKEKEKYTHGTYVIMRKERNHQDKQTNICTCLYVFVYI